MDTAQIKNSGPYPKSERHVDFLIGSTTETRVVKRRKTATIFEVRVNPFLAQFSVGDVSGS